MAAPATRATDRTDSMAIGRDGRRFFEVPHAAVYLLITANIVAYAACLRQSGTEAIPAELLLRNGAMYGAAIERGEYWRLIAAGFLHANLFHLATNMICLALWGGHLERRVGSFYFIVIYVCALIAGALVGRLTHPGPYLSVGASGAISGILGALLCLWVLGKIDVTASFFVINIGLNVALAYSVRNIDWGAHLGGFAAGLISCALIDLLEKANALVLRCKFPEFVKINAFIVVGGVALLLGSGRPIASFFNAGGWWLPAACLAACLLVIKLCDLLLSIKHGLAVIVVAFAVANGALVLVAGGASASAVRSVCASRNFPPLVEIGNALRDAACARPSLTLVIAAAAVCALTILACSQELDRGIRDVGFVGVTLRAERKRRRGI
jgi:membrane associated rhomboid family serine protease